MSYRLFLMLVTLTTSSLIYADTSNPTGTQSPQEGEVHKLFRQGEELIKGEFKPGYNMPARTKVEHKAQRPDFFNSLNFLYYYANQGGMDLADSGMLSTNNPGSGTSTVSTTNSQSLTQQCSYQPGFQVGIGVGYSEWSVNANYTWIRQSTTTSKTAPTPVPNSFGPGVWVINNWFQQITPSAQTLSATHLRSKWKVNIDMGDVLLNHAYYQGPTLIVTPFFGLRSAFIRQYITVGATVPTLVVPTLSSSIIHSYNSSNSWSIGPRVGFDGSYLLGKGLRFEGKLGASLLVTQYTHVSHKEQTAIANSVPSIIGAKLSNYNCLRPEADLSIGLGYGTYLCNGKYHIDLIANYDFIMFFEQNMIRKLLDQTISGVSPAVSNLYLYGLNIGLKFDF